jgi:hypothetical protein
MMNFLIKNQTACLFILVPILSGIGIIVGTVNADAQQSEIDKINQNIDALSIEADALVEKALEQDRIHVSNLSCSQLLTETNQFDSYGDYWADQTSDPYSK